MKKSLTVLAILVVFGVVIWGGYQLLKSKPAVSYITIDINPSVELAVDKDDNVAEVLPLNEDADIITSDLDLVGTPVDEASEKIINAATETGYIDDLSETNTVVVTSSAENDDKRLALEKKIIDKLNTHFETTKVYALVVAKGLDDELKSEADSYGITYGKMLLIQTALAYDPTLDKDKLSDMSIQDIQKTIKSYVTARHADMKMKRKEAIQTWKEQKQQKIQAFKAIQEQAKETLWSTVKDQYKNATPREKAQIIKNLVDQRKTQIKEGLDSLKGELQQEKDSIKQDLKDYRNSTYNYPVLENKYNKLKEAIQNRRNNRQQ